MRHVISKRVMSVVLAGAMTVGLTSAMTGCGSSKKKEFCSSKTEFHGFRVSLC